MSVDFLRCVSLQTRKVTNNKGASSFRGSSICQEIAIAYFCIFAGAQVNKCDEDRRQSKISQ